MNDNDNKEDVEEKTDIQLTNDLYSYVKDLADLKHSDELRRRDSLFQQSNSMQSAFAFISAAIAMVMPVVFQYSKLSCNFLCTAFATIFATLFISLLLASITQWRRKRPMMQSIGEIEAYFQKNWKTADNKSKRLYQYIEMIREIDDGLEKENDHSVKLINASMIFLFISLGLCTFWFLVGIAFS